MTESIQVSPGVGESVGTKRLNGIQHQRVVDGLDRKTILLTPTITAGAYAANEALGGKLSFASAFREPVAGCSLAIEEIFIASDANALTPDLRLLIFGQDMSVSVADKVSYSMVTTDLLRLQGVVDFASAGYVQVGTVKRFNSQKLSPNLVITWAAGNTAGNLYILPVATGVFTPAASNALTIGVKIRMD